MQYYCLCSKISEQHSCRIHLKTDSTGVGFFNDYQNDSWTNDNLSFATKYAPKITTDLNHDLNLMKNKLPVQLALTKE